MNGITAFSTLFTASLRWNYPNRFRGSPCPAKAGQGLSAQVSSPSYLILFYILTKESENVKSAIRLGSVIVVSQIVDWSND